MHELGIATALLDSIDAQRAAQPARIVAAGVRIGAYSGVNVDSLRFCFETLVLDRNLGPLALTVEETNGEDLHLAWLETEDPP
jgi:Zn finger protein HypA/HybF involved in hydrogenase expression